MGESGPSVMTAHSFPSPSPNVQPWYAQLSVPGNCWFPSDSGTPRCGQRSCSAYAVPPSLIRTTFSPQTVCACGLPVTLLDQVTGYQSPRKPAAAALYRGHVDQSCRPTPRGRPGRTGPSAEIGGSTRIV